MIYVFFSFLARGTTITAVKTIASSHKTFRVRDSKRNTNVLRRIIAYIICTHTHTHTHTHTYTVDNNRFFAFELSPRECEWYEWKRKYRSTIDAWNVRMIVEQVSIDRRTSLFLSTMVSTMHFIISSDRVHLPGEDGGSGPRWKGRNTYTNTRAESEILTSGNFAGYWRDSRLLYFYF